MIPRSVEQYAKRLDVAAERFRYEVAMREEGTVTSVGDGIVTCSGLSSVRSTEILTFENGSRALALDLGENLLGAARLDTRPDLRVGMAVRSAGQVASAPVGEGLVGRIIDPLGQPKDEGGSVASQGFWPVERPAPPLIDRAAVTEPLHTGITMIDALFPVGRGQRQLILGDRGTGKTTIAVDTIINQAKSGVFCVYVSIGQMASDLLAVIRQLRNTGALSHTVVVVAAADAPPGVRFLAPYAGSTIAEYFRDRGQHALVVFDHLEAHAVAYRELALLLRRPPGREAFPGDIFYIHARLLERSTQLSDALGGGSLTALPIAETRAGRIADFIPTNLISITDGQLFLDAHAFERGTKPAIAIGTSVSRVGGKTQKASMREASGKLRLDLARFEEVEVFSRFGARVEDQTRRLLRRGVRARELLKQPPSSPIPLSEQVALLLALDDGAFDDIDEQKIALAASELRARLKSRAPEILEALERGHAPNTEERARIADLAKLGEKRSE